MPGTDASATDAIALARRHAAYLGDAENRGFTDFVGRVAQGEARASVSLSKAREAYEWLLGFSAGNNLYQPPQEILATLGALSRQYDRGAARGNSPHAMSARAFVGGEVTQASLVDGLMTLQASPPSLEERPTPALGDSILSVEESTGLLSRLFMFAVALPNILDRPQARLPPLREGEHFLDRYIADLKMYVHLMGGGPPANLEELTIQVTDLATRIFAKLNEDQKKLITLSELEKRLNQHLKAAYFLSYQPTEAVVPKDREELVILATDLATRVFEDLSPNQRSTTNLSALEQRILAHLEAIYLTPSSHPQGRPARLSEPRGRSSSRLRRMTGRFR